MKIDIPFGAALTRLATLPPRAKRSLEDPYEDKAAAKQMHRAMFLLFLLVLAGAAIWVRWDHSRRGHYFWKPAPAVQSVAEPKPSPPG